MYRKIALSFLILFFLPHLAWAQTSGSSVRYSANNIADVVGDLEVSGDVTAATLTALPDATDGGEFTLTEGLDDGTNTFRISVPASGLSASVDHETNAAGRLPTTAIQDLAGDVSGPLGTTVVGDDSHAHTTTTVSGLLDANMANDALDPDKIVGDAVDDNVLDVAAGGTGVATLTDGGVLLGSGTGGITAMSVLANGEVIVGDGTTDPVAESGATLRTSIGLGTGDNATFTDGIFTGTLQGLNLTTTTTAATLVLTAANSRMHVHVNGDADAIDFSLDTAVAGYSMCFYGLFSGVITIDAATGDEIILNGTGVGAADAIDSPGVAGDFICLFAIDATNWVSLGRSGTWVDGGVD